MSTSTPIGAARLSTRVMRRREITNLKAQVDRDRKYEHIKVRLGRRCRSQEMKLKEIRATNVSNKVHPMEFMRAAHYL